MSLPRALDTKIYIRISLKTKALLLSLTTASQDDLSSAATMGSFVYALPDVRIKPHFISLPWSADGNPL
jgi:hypothetical protein